MLERTSTSTFVGKVEYYLPLKTHRIFDGRHSTGILTGLSPLKRFENNHTFTWVYHAPIVLLLFSNVGYLPCHMLHSMRAVVCTPTLQCHVRTYSSGINSQPPTIRGRKPAMWRVVGTVTMLGLRGTMPKPSELHACSRCIFSCCIVSR